jgi:hypothetical protein
MRQTGRCQASEEYPLSTTSLGGRKGGEQEVADRLAETAKAALGWAGNNGVEFDQRKREAVLFKSRGPPPSASIRVGCNEFPFSKEATWWLGAWLDSQVTLQAHHAIRLEEGREAMGRLRWLTGQMGLSPFNCQKVMTACIQSVAMFVSELWWKGDGVVGTIGRAESCSYWSTSRLGQSRAAFERQTWGHWQWSQDSCRQQSAGEPSTAVRTAAAQSTSGRLGQRGGRGSVDD